MTFEEVWEYTSTVPGWFGEEESRALFAQANAIKRGNFVEIGCWAGKSSSILLQVAAAADVYVNLIDPFVWLEGDSWPAFQKYIIEKFPADLYSLHKMESREAFRYMPHTIDLLHIDGDHTRRGITADCVLYLPLLRSGGVVCVHDYTNPAYPDIVTALDEYTSGWEDLGVYNTLAIRRKP